LALMKVRVEMEDGVTMSSTKKLWTKLSHSRWRILTLEDQYQPLMK